ncbi:acetyltransferase [Legionella sp. W05-934-2]|uniref:acetyltransferase n=1 Tax=Legionella sp. W05-934-2 TaxID=1198649 RepID=UPI003461F16A
MLNPIVVIGGGGHAKVLLEAIHLLNMPILGVLDNSETLKEVHGVPILGSDKLLDNFKPSEVALVNGLGSLKPYSKRTDIFKSLKQKGYKFVTIIHPSAIVAKNTHIGEGVQIMAGVIIQPGVTIGDNVIINTRASIDHDCVIGEHTHIAPGVTLSGNVSVGRQVHIGTGATLIQGINIGSGSTLAAGAVMTKDCSEGAYVMGVPGKEVMSCE